MNVRREERHRGEHASILGSTEMRPLIAALAGVLASSSVAWAKGAGPATAQRASVELAKRAVPGAALLFPVGKVTRDEPGHETGKFQVQIGEGGRAQLGWTTGDPLSAEELDRTLVKPLRQSMGLSIAQMGPVRVAGNPGSRWVLRNDNGSMILSVWSCGKREFHLIVVHRDDPAGLERRIRDSFVCKPDPGRAGKPTASKPAGAR
jgi:hypothetical protein